tara:strand:- start:2741 stop:3769 length:1029 start_codon:yes stop_codon:yes gene_type:complete
MDPISQGVLGAISSQSFARNKNILIAAFCGFISASTPDLDILIRSTSDPLLKLEYHRHFTHSLLFIPIGALIVAFLLWGIFFRKNHKFIVIYLFSFIGFATHGLLDAMTSYGTLLYWPFYGTRVNWNVISIIDPLFTIPLLIFCIISCVKKSSFIARIGLCIALLYLLIGYSKHYQIKKLLFKVAKSQHHIVEDYFIDPTIANNMSWRAIYKYKKHFYIYAFYISPFFSSDYIKGDTVETIDIEKIFPYLDRNSKQINDIKRFDIFTSSFMSLHHNNKNIIIDLRYNMLPQSSKHPLWGIVIDENNKNQHAEFKMLSEQHFDRLSVFWMLLNGDFDNLKKHK